MKVKIIGIITNLALLCLAIFFSYLFAGRFYDSIYSFIYGSSAGGLFIVYEKVAEFLTVLVLSSIFFISLIFTAFGDSTKYWWVGILLIPAVAFELYFDLEHIYIPIAIGLIGWIIGFIVSKIVAKLKVMPD